MLAYFPSLKRGELLYSAIARFGAHMGIRPVESINRLLVGPHKNVALAYHLPVRLALLAEQLPRPGAPSAEQLIEGHTLYPYYASTFGDDLAVRLRAAMVEGGQTSFVGSIARKMPRPSRLRFCPECLATMTSDDGEGYWRREHQLESTLVCVEHGTDLLCSTVEPINAAKYEVASLKTCPISPSPLPKMTSSQRALLIELAGEGNLLLEGRSNVRDEMQMSSFQSALGAKGITVGTHGSRKLFQQAFEERFGFLAQVWPTLFDESSYQRSWFDVFFSGQRSNVHPACALIFRKTIEALETKEPPFGNGPWPCLNPVGGHYLRNTISKVDRRRAKGKWFGTFSCACGFSYGRSIDSEGVLSRPSLKGQGSWLDDHVLEALSSAKTLTQTAAEARTEPEQIRAAATRLGYANAWPKRRRRKTP